MFNNKFAGFVAPRNAPMGRWMEVVRERLPDAENFLERRRPLILGEIAPNPLMDATRCLPTEARWEFPFLDRTTIDSGAYDGEEMWIDCLGAEGLLKDFRRFRQVCRFETFVKGVTAEILVDRWRGGVDQQEFERWLDKIEGLLDLAVREQAWVYLSL
jgi:hypothetical protein